MFSINTELNIDLSRGNPSRAPPDARKGGDQATRQTIRDKTGSGQRLPVTLQSAISHPAMYLFRTPSQQRRLAAVMNDLRGGFK